MELTLERLTPFLPPNLTAAQRSDIAVWLPVVSVKLTVRYGDRITSAVEPLFLSYAAAAVARRLHPTDPTIASQSVGPASVRYNDSFALQSWFWPQEIADMDATAGIGGVSTVRFSAPDAVRLANRAGTFYDADMYADLDDS